MSAGLKNRIEAILYAAGKGASVDDLAGYTGKRKAEVTKALKKLQQEYESRDTSLQIREHDGKWKLGVKGAYTEDVKSIVSETELAAAILKTLAVIAYKSPVLQSDIIDMRGQGAYDHIKELAKTKFITKEKSGRSYLLKVTEKFYEYFDVEGDEEIREVFDSLREEQASQQKLEVVEMQSEKGKKDSEGMNTTPQARNDQQKLGELEIVDAGEEKQATKTKHDVLKKERENEKSFLDDVDKRINDVSQRVSKQELPQQHAEKEQKDPSDQAGEKPEGQAEKQQDDTVTSSKEHGTETPREQAQDNKQSGGSETEGQDEEKPLEKIESFLEEEKRKDTTKKHYL